MPLTCKDASVYASDSTARRTLAALDETALAKIQVERALNAANEPPAGPDPA